MDRDYKDISYIIYDGSKDRYKNTLVVYNDCMVHKQEIIIRADIKIIWDYGPIILVGIGNMLYRHIKQKDEILGATTNGIIDNIIYGILYGDLWYRWFNTNGGVYMYLGTYDTNWNESKRVVEPIAIDPMVALMRYRKKHINRISIVYHNDLLKRFRSRGIKWSKRFVDISVCN